MGFDGRSRWRLSAARMTGASAQWRSLLMNDGINVREHCNNVGSGCIAVHEGSTAVQH